MLTYGMRKKIYLPQKNYSLTHYEIKIGEYEGSSKLNGGVNPQAGESSVIDIYNTFPRNKGLLSQNKKEKHEKKVIKHFF